MSLCYLEEKETEERKGQGRRDLFAFRYGNGRLAVTSEIEKSIEAKRCGEHSSKGLVSWNIKTSRQ
ncbi:hypothetical protein M408DRAFT_334289 [Serendipita vermifera MAFF 305830]|uniref:Uncharacterized protein n=1 Tax=Serendipita vermifera MAFF 305830 TaxID=933852 RepID=A0A0C3A4Y6_SERVB|nr:hypothetical protein M408DRAFT_334289 [Serendipita vermifera MAFF 305830]